MIYRLYKSSIQKQVCSFMIYEPDKVYHGSLLFDIIIQNTHQSLLLLCNLLVLLPHLLKPGLLLSDHLG